MKLNGRHELALPRSVAWDLINDTEVLKKCIPGCEELTLQSPGVYDAKVILKIGPVKATFSGTVKMVDIVEPQSFRLTGEASGGVAGMASGHADVRLEPNGEGTVLTYRASADVAGKLAQLGSRLIDSTVTKLSRKFFDNFENEAAALENAQKETG